MSINTFVSGSPPGAGRFYDYEWDLNAAGFMTQGNAQNFSSAAPTAAVSRIAGQLGVQYNGVSSFQVGGGGNILAGLYKGRMCARFNTLGPANIATRTSFTTQYTKPPFNVTSDEPLCWRYVVIMANGGTQASVSPNDNGIMFMRTTSLGGGPLYSAFAGFGVEYRSDGIPIYFTKSDPAGLALQTPIATVADTEWHSFEFRIQGATSKSAATLAVLMDGITVVQDNWANGNLPDFVSDTASVGMLCQITNGSTSYTPLIYVNRFRIMAAPTLQALF